ncbi:hypothetical protein [Amycolatopsis sp. Hca4]|uniref:hypothetical protein n=1 Tax=Amycolatopsis sp. Hca4 TaxID=2742131 RepID=UPI0015928843|nr:hypothetical protein [Amycolatopsis sp. Hca4]QKV73932.1 hypothetical protein HUT10_09225 [Amycolatopsis sp. Hca4]
MESSTLARATRIPGAVQSARVLLAAIAISHLVTAVVLGIDRSALRDQIASQHPELAATEVARSATVAVTAGAVFHGILLAVCLLTAWKLATARSWTRRLATVSQVLSVVFSVVSWSSSPMFHAVIPAVGAAQLLVVALLWTPSSAREFFAKRT